MFPNPQDALPLPPRPSVAQYRKLAKDLVRICKSGESAAFADWSSQWVQRLAALSGLVITPGLPVEINRWAAQVEEFGRRTLAGADGKACRLADAQFVLARSHGFANWPMFVRHIEESARARSSASIFEAAADAIIDGKADTLKRLLREN